MSAENLCDYVADTCKELAVLTRKSGFERLGCILEIAEAEARNSVSAAKAEDAACAKQRKTRPAA